MTQKINQYAPVRPKRSKFNLCTLRVSHAYALNIQLLVVLRECIHGLAPSWISPMQKLNTTLNPPFPLVSPSFAMLLGE
jgi:hypothetical protein